jgi:hypothetical protein
MKGLTTFRPSVKYIKGFELEAGNNQPSHCFYIVLAYVVFQLDHASVGAETFTPPHSTPTPNSKIFHRLDFVWRLLAHSMTLHSWELWYVVKFHIFSTFKEYFQDSRVSGC